MRVVSIIALILLTACSNTDSLKSMNTDIVIAPTEPQPITTKPVEFKVINRSTLGSIDLDSKSWYAVDSHSYENLAYNMQDILRYLKQQNAVIEYYKKVYSDNSSN